MIVSVWLAKNALTLIVAAILLIAVGLAVFSLVRDRKKGSGKCTGNCSCCKMGCAYGNKK